MNSQEFLPKNFPVQGNPDLAEVDVCPILRERASDAIVRYKSRRR